MLERQLSQKHGVTHLSIMLHIDRFSMRMYGEPSKIYRWMVQIGFGN